MTNAKWQTSNDCGSFNNYKFYDVTKRMRFHCDGRQSCEFIVNDNTFAVSCKEQLKRCTQLTYEYMCISKFYVD